MKTAMNIQMTGAGANGNNSKMEATIMKAQPNIQNIIQSNTKLLAGLVVGGMIAAASMLPGSASADNPARPVGQVESAVLTPTSTTANVIDMDFLEPGFYDAKLARSNSSTGAFDMDLLDPGIYDAKLVRTSSVWESPGFDPYEDVAAKSVRSNSSTGAFDMDLLDPGIYDAKLVRTSSVWESPGFDPYEDVAAKSVRTGSTAHGFDMDLLDPGIYDAKLVTTSSDLGGLHDDNII